MYNVANDTQIQLTNSDIQVLMTECQAKRWFLPRDVIKNFISILNLMTQYPDKNFAELCGKTIVENPKGVEKTGTDGIDEVEEI